MRDFVPALFVSFVISTTIQSRRFDGASGFETGPAYLLVLCLLALSVFVYILAAVRGRARLRMGAGGAAVGLLLALVFAWLSEA